jgi:hypothetical protein
VYRKITLDAINITLLSASGGVGSIAIINELIALFDRPQQREAQRLAAEALGETWREHRS